MDQLILDRLDLLGRDRVVVRRQFLAGLELIGKSSNGAGKLILADLELLAEVRILAGHHFATGLELLDLLPCAGEIA